MPKFAIKDIRANPFRHIDRYPIRKDKVAALRESIRTTSFWDNIVARRRDGHAEIAYGHHRLIALTEEYGPDHQVDLIVRELPDEAMVQIMARENMEEWGSSAAVEHETLRAVVEAYADGRITIPPIDPKTARYQVRYAPSFAPGDASVAPTTHPYTAQTLAKFLGWVQPSGEAQDKVTAGLTALEFIDAGVLQESDFDGLTTSQAKAVIEQARRAAAQREATARLHRQQAEEAARQAAAAERRGEELERERQVRQEAVARARDEVSRRQAKEEASRFAEARRRAEEERRLAERRRATEERREREERERARRQATKVGREVSRELQAGRIGYREAPMVAARVTEKRPGPPPLMNDFARRLAADLNAVLDPDRDQRVKRIEVMIEYRADLSPAIRRDLSRTLAQLKERAGGYERRLSENGGTTSELTTEAQR